MTNFNAVTVTIRADLDCQVICDGNPFLTLTANQIGKGETSAGQHILQFVAAHDPQLCLEKIVDFPFPGKNYLVLVDEFKPLMEKMEAERIVTFEYQLGDDKGTYEGHTRNGLPEGTGKFTFSDSPSKIFEGYFVAGKRNGRGRLTFDEIVLFDGDYKNDLPDGYGKGRIGWEGTYEGEWKKGWRHGHGTMTYDNGDVYEGEWKQGKIHGHGKKVSANGDIYDGEWDEGWFKTGRWYDSLMNQWVEKK